MSSGIKARLKKAETAAKKAMALAADEDTLDREFVERYPRTAEFILRSEDSPQIRAVMNRLDTDDFHTKSAWNWLLAPYACWATQPDRYDLPAALLVFMALPAPPYWAAIQACTVCGLKVPRLTHPNGEQPFAKCPACGSETDQRAIFGPPGTAAFDTGWE